MYSIHDLNRTEGSLVSARALLAIAHFIFDHADGDDFQRMKEPFGFLLNTLDAELRETDRGVDHLYRTNFAANDRGKSA